MDDDQPYTTGELRDALTNAGDDQPVGIKLPDGQRAVIRDTGHADDAFILHAEYVE